MKNLVMLVIVIATIASAASGQGVIKNSSSKAVIIKDMRLDKDLQLRIGGTVSLSADPGVVIYPPIIFLSGEKMDTIVSVKMIFPRKGDIFELKDTDLKKTAPKVADGKKFSPTPEATVNMVGKRVKNDLDAVLFFQDRGICLAPGKTSNELVQLSPNERIIIERNYRLFFLEINDFFASNDKVYVVNEKTLLRGEGQDSVKISLTAGEKAYAFIDDKSKEVKGIRDHKGRGGYAKNFPEGANTIMCQTLKNGVAQTRYYTFMASSATQYVSPPPNAFDNPPLYFGRTVSLPIEGFDKNCSVELLDALGKSLSGRIVIDEKGTSAQQDLSLGMNRVRVTFFERTPQGRVRYSIEYFKLVSETDEVFKIEPEYLWLLEGPPVTVKPKNVATDRIFQNLEIWANDRKTGKPKKLVIKKDYPSEMVSLREGIVRKPGRYTEGLSIRNLTCTFIISYMDKNKDVMITDDNIDRSQE